MIGPNQASIRQSIEALFQPGDVVELRILGHEGHYQRTWAGYFNDPDKLVDAAMHYAAKPSVYGTYITLNPCDSRLLSRANNRVAPRPKHATSDPDIVERRLILIDIDPIRPAGVSSSEEEKTAARELALTVYTYLSRFFGQGIAADSGNGWHILYRCDLPNDEDTATAISDLLQALDFRFTNEHAEIDTKVYNASRITKLYGTPGRKGDSTSLRPHRVSQLKTIPSAMRAIGLPEIAAVIQDISPPRADTPVEQGSGSFDVSMFLENAGLEYKGPASWRSGRKWLLPVCPYNEEHKSSAYIVQMPSGALAAGCHHNSCSWCWKDLRAKYDEDKADPLSFGAFPNMSDMGNAEMLANQFGNDLLYVSEWGSWAIWTGSRWKKDVTGEIIRRAKLVAQLRYDLIDAYVDDKTRKRAFHWAQASESLERVKAMDVLARAHPGMTISAEQLDKNEWIVNCTNGVVDLLSGSLLKHDKHRLLSKNTDVAYDEGADCPRWKQFLSEIFNGDDELIRYIQKLSGYILSGSVSEQILPIFYGTGNNGKSTFLLTLRKAMGDYARQVAPDILLQNRNDSHPASIAVLHGTRLALTVETGRGKQLDEALVKQLTGGDPIQARFMRQDPFEFLPTHKIVMATNYQPVIKGDDVGIWRRIHLVPFTVCIPKDQVDKTLDKKLEAELPGILRWAVEGALLWQSEGLDMPEAVEHATGSYRREQDFIGDFLEDHCLVGEEHFVTSSDLYSRYCMWCEDQGQRAPSQRGLGLMLAERGFKRGKKGRARVWFGLALHFDHQEITFAVGQKKESADSR